MGRSRAAAVVRPRPAICRSRGRASRPRNCSSDFGSRHRDYSRPAAEHASIVELARRPGAPAAARLARSCSAPASRPSTPSRARRCAIRARSRIPTRAAARGPVARRGQPAGYRRRARLLGRLRLGVDRSRCRVELRSAGAAQSSAGSTTPDRWQRTICARCSPTRAPSTSVAQHPVAAARRVHRPRSGSAHWRARQSDLLSRARGGRDVDLLRLRRRLGLRELVP